jgi:uncharacterized protein YjeT (DUF2065 family)
MNYLQVIQLLGITYTVIGLGILFNPKYYKKMIDEYVRSTPVMFLNGFIVLGLGYLFLISGNTETTAAPLFVTLIGWLALLKGLFILIAPQAYVRIAKSINLHHLMLEGVITFILGAILLYVGFLR